MRTEHSSRTQPQRVSWALVALGCALALFHVAARSRVAPAASPRTPVERFFASLRMTSETNALRGAEPREANLLPQMQFATGLGVRIYDGSNTLVLDPCKANAKSYASISQTANAQLAAGVAGKKIYVCSIHVVVAAAANVAVVEGTGSVCATGTAGVPGFGGATAATGWNFSANGGIALGNGDSSLGGEATAGDNLCVFNSGSGQVSGGITYVAQ